MELVTIVLIAAVCSAVTVVLAIKAWEFTVEWLENRKYFKIVSPLFEKKHKLLEEDHTDSPFTK